MGHGPAAAPHGYCRVDEWALSGDGAEEETIVAIEVAGYNVNSFYTLAEPSFLQAELLTSDGRPLCWTGADGERGFEAGELRERLRRTQRYSFQRAFTEAYRLQADAADWRSSAAAAPGARADWARVSGRLALPRGVPLPAFPTLQPLSVCESGAVAHRLPPDGYRKDRSLTGVGPLYLGYPEAELGTVPSLLLQEAFTTERRVGERPYVPDAALRLEARSYRIVDFGRVAAGFIQAEVVCAEPARLYLMFDEVLSGGEVDFLRLDAVNAVAYELGPGVHSLETIEPYSLRYLKLLVWEGSADIRGIGVREYACGDAVRGSFASGDPALDAIVAAGIETYRQNAVDVFMDCPSRERAGWLCDSFFMARTAAALSGTTLYERLFLENYALPERFAHLPEGMVPMCYPADHFDGNFIPNWGLWFVLQLGEYAARSGDADMLARLRPRVASLMRYFEPFRNADGLLERLDGWIFVDWSPAREWVQDVSYPTNMLYAAALEAAGRLYGSGDWLRQAEAVRTAVRSQSFTGEYFADHAVRTAEGLRIETGHVSEACQYYAFCFGIAEPDTYPELWRTLVERLGPRRRGIESGRAPGVAPTNQLIGNMLRLEALSAAGRADVIAAELPELLGGMASATGTLWEQDEPIASCSHGFVSHVVHVAYRDLLGFRHVDPLRRTVVLRPGQSGLLSCAGALPVGGDLLAMSWRYADGKLHIETDIPDDYEVALEIEGPYAWQRKERPG
ncbi:alpha-L-rhamnosidase-related protein [Cohnella rhizosphaerae]|uniref:Alpha-L-rhamnosidase six-hairpin glycosidase domain-containing protein n=1 Tax=Cohnella rhizosphaerae TaxID=1457232 RepID=A0A9X4KR44_9BACL|nr:hypothetical protein [Cohnella rhizosphaerae]MDG0809584.1 hypothetical protein [Cohnella rhizosphaerae]